LVFLSSKVLVELIVAKKTQQMMFTIVAPITDAIVEAGPAGLRIKRHAIIKHVGEFVNANISANAGYEKLAVQLSDLYIGLSAGEPEQSEHHKSFDSKTVKDALLRLEAPGSVFYAALHSKAGRVMRSDADRKFRSGANDGVANMLFDRINVGEEQLGLASSFFSNYEVAGSFADAYGPHAQWASETDGHVAPIDVFRSRLAFLDTSCKAVHQALEGWSTIGLEDRFEPVLAVMKRIAVALCSFECGISRAVIPSMLLKLKQVDLECQSLAPDTLSQTDNVRDLFSMAQVCQESYKDHLGELESVMGVCSKVFKHEKLTDILAFSPLDSPPISSMVAYIKIACNLAAVPDKMSALKSLVPDLGVVFQKPKSASKAMPQGTPYLEAVVKFVSIGSRLNDVGNDGRIDPSLSELLHYIASDSNFFYNVCRVHADSQSDSFTNVFKDSLYYKYIAFDLTENDEFTKELTAGEDRCTLGLFASIEKNSGIVKNVRDLFEKYLCNFEGEPRKIFTKADGETIAGLLPHRKCLTTLDDSSKMITALGINAGMWKPFVNHVDEKNINMCVVMARLLADFNTVIMSAFFAYDKVHGRGDLFVPSDLKGQAGHYVIDNKVAWAMICMQSAMDRCKAQLESPTFEHADAIGEVRDVANNVKCGCKWFATFLNRLISFVFGSAAKESETLAKMLSGKVPEHVMVAFQGTSINQKLARTLSILSE
jgi:hypothetical protein